MQFYKSWIGIKQAMLSFINQSTPDVINKKNTASYLGSLAVSLPYFQKHLED